MAEYNVKSFLEAIKLYTEELKQLEPFGLGNEEPIFRLKNIEIIEIKKMGSENQHLRIDVKRKDGNSIKLVSFFSPEDWLNLDYTDKIEPTIQLIENEWNGVRSVEARILELNML